MRGDRSMPRGEAGRVAARVRDLLRDAEVSGGGGQVEGDAHAVAPPSAARAHAGARPGRWESLLARVSPRVDPGRRAALAVGAAVVLAALATGLWLVMQRPRTLAVSTSPPPLPGASTVGSVSPGGASARATGAPSSVPRAAGTSAPVVVDVAGKVRRPGLYRLRAGSRVDDALKAAGGALRGVDLSRLNLAARVQDGQQIAVGSTGAPPAPGGGDGSSVGGSGGGPATAGSAASAPIDLNAATLDQLETLPGVGPVLGQHILDWRAEHGRFDTVDQLRDVSGIGDVKFAALRTRVAV